MEVVVVHAGGNPRIFTESNECTGGEHHPGVEVFNSKIEMERVVDPACERVNQALVNRFVRCQPEVIALVL